jgi:CMP-N-acetylneuraminic acid synthetase
VPEPTVLGVVTARAGSKGLPGKNTRLLAGKPLVAYTIEAAHASAIFDRLMITTDDERAAAIARDLGCEVPFLRPPELSTDDTPHLPVMVHAARWLRDRERYQAEWTMILMPTSPLRQARHIVESVELAVRSKADAVVSVDAVPSHFHPQRMLAVDPDGWARLFVGDRPVRERPVRRQGLPDAWVFNGAIYLFRTSLLFEASPSLYGDRVQAYAMAAPYGHNIDDAEDWAEAERLLTKLGLTEV